MKIEKVLKAPEGHWVGDGFPVRSMFGDLSFTADISPFLMMDYGGPAEFKPTSARRGVGVHPHRGFETVTIVYQGEVEHGDSVGHHGTIGPGDVQWMTAASGILHEEYHSKEFAKKGGMFEMVQLWVNLPAKSKSVPPRYQSLLRKDIPVVELANGSGTVRVIAGQFGNTAGAAKTYSPVNVWDVRLKAGSKTDWPMPSGFKASVFVMKGKIKDAGNTSVGEAELAIVGGNGDSLRLEAAEDTALLFLSGEPIKEPIVAYGPFVMNTEGEIKQAMLDFQSGRFGKPPS